MDFDLPKICCRDNTAGYKRFRSFVACVGDNFLTQMIKEYRRETLLDLILTSKEEVVRIVKAWDSPGCSDCVMVESKIPIEGKKANCSITVPWSSGEQTLASTVICLEESYGRWSWREEGSKTAG
ncbi:hypothetical protein GRJ2_000838900 [Grus japonensis]|uniref:Uncharacterized protein n=1 Tax=Grus japonensis TaxID=30415 RepID=A0ABC9WEP0_GRUJA